MKIEEVNDFINSVVAEAAANEKPTIRVSLGESSIDIPSDTSSVMHVAEAIHVVLKAV